MAVVGSRYPPSNYSASRDAGAPLRQGQRFLRPSVQQTPQAPTATPMIIPQSFAPSHQQYAVPPQTNYTRGPPGPAQQQHAPQYPSAQPGALPPQPQPPPQPSVYVQNLNPPTPPFTPHIPYPGGVQYAPAPAAPIPGYNVAGQYQQPATTGPPTQSVYGAVPPPQTALVPLPSGMQHANQLQPGQPPSSFIGTITTPPSNGKPQTIPVYKRIGGSNNVKGSGAFLVQYENAVVVAKYCKITQHTDEKGQIHPAWSSVRAYEAPAYRAINSPNAQGKRGHRGLPKDFGSSINCTFTDSTTRATMQIDIVLIERLGPDISALMPGIYQGTYPGTGDTMMFYVHCKELLSALEYLHSKNIVHNDIKPENINLPFKTDVPEENSLKLMDFDSIGYISRSDGPYINPSNIHHDTFGPGDGLPTIHYMSRNRHRLLHTAARDDLESMGFVFYQYYHGPANLPWRKRQPPDERDKKAFVEFGSEMFREKNRFITRVAEEPGLFGTLFSEVERLQANITEQPKYHVIHAVIDANIQRHSGQNR